MSYQWTAPALASNYCFTYEDGCDFNRVYFGDVSQGIVDVQNCDYYVNCARPLDVSLVDFLGSDQLVQFYPCRQLTSSNLLPYSTDGLSAGTTINGIVPYTEPQHLLISGSLNSVVTVSRNLPLKCFPKTLLCFDKNLMFGQDMFLRFWTN